MRALEAIATQRVVPVLRTADAEDAVATARAAGAAGMRVVELTLTTPGVHEALRELRDGELVLGLGSLLERDDVARAVAAGAEFVVSFGSVSSLAAAAHGAGVPAIVGAFTPGEVLAATAAQADAVKIFPARLASPAYLRDLQAVLPNVRLMPTGGIDPGSASAWLEAGAWAVGIGGALGTAASVGAAEVERRCRAALAAA
jgi:2-dehydro-3-deoxyphosphogluconate aldolase/(4S)-4-hydroxy-2-oxoglutarate aldolase